MKRKMGVNTIFALIGTIFFVIGLVLSVIGSFRYNDFNEFMETAETTQATITEIEEDVYYRKGRRRIRHYAWASYTIDGNYYNKKLDHYSSTMYVGARIWVYYDPDNPSDVRTGSRVSEIVLFGMGGGFVIIGGVFLIIVIFKKNKVKNLKLNGEQFTGTITNVVQNRHVRINGRHPFKAEVEMKNPFDGETYLYSSDNISDDISQFVGSQVTVYVDKNKKSRYYVDMDSLLSNYYEQNKIHDFR
jgi:hypothetical protein